MRIAILGSGGVGGYFGGRLARARRDVVASSREARTSRRFGERSAHREPDGDLHLPPVNATDDPAASARGHIVFFTVKLYDTEGGSRASALVGPRDARHPVPERRGQRGRAVAGRRAASTSPAEPRYLAAVHLRAGRDPTHRHEPVDLRIARWRPLDPSPVEQLPTPVSGRASTHVERSTSWSTSGRSSSGLTVFSGMTAVTRCSIGPLRDDAGAGGDDARRAVEESVAVARRARRAADRCSDRRRFRWRPPRCPQRAVVDARGSRARPSARTALVERRRRPHRPGSRRRRRPFTVSSRPSFSRT